MVGGAGDKRGASLWYQDFQDSRAEDRRQSLLNSLGTFNGYVKVVPQVALGRPFKPSVTSHHYLEWARLPELFPHSYPGVKTSRDGALIDTDRAALEQRMNRYFNRKVGDAEIAVEMSSLMENSGRFNASKERMEALHHGLDRGYFVRYCYRPMDVRWLYWYPIGKLLDEKRPDYFPQVFPGNQFIEARQKLPQDQFDRGFVTSCLADNLGNGLSNYFPLWIRESMPSAEPHVIAEPKINLSTQAENYLSAIAVNEQSLFFHALAVMNSPAYRHDNAGGLRQDWPRIPLPESSEALLASAALGREVAALLDTESPAPGVTSGAVRDELKTIAVVSRVGGGTLTATEFALTAGWGSGGQGGITMPGKGKAECRVSGPEEHCDGFGAVPTLDVYLNATAYWKNIPQPVWDFTIGGYQVIKKWLSYREQRVLGRALTMAEIVEVTAMARRLAALVLLQAKLDENYQSAAAATWAFDAVT